MEAFEAMTKSDIKPLDVDVEPRFQCGICRGFLSEPFQSSCGVRLCRSCLITDSETSMTERQQKQLICDVCGQEQTTERHRFFPDRSIDREMRGKRARCSNDGCGEELTLQSLVRHEKVECEWRAQLCEYGCGVWVSGKARAEHQELAKTAHLSWVQERLKERNTEIDRLTTLNQQLLRKSLDLSKRLQDTEASLGEFQTQGRSCEDGDDIYTAAGDFLWVIPQFRDRMEMAKQSVDSGDPSLLLLSRRFYTGYPGYLLQLRLYPAGDGPGRGSHISIYLALLRGQHDSEVMWPFSRRISISLLPSKIVTPVVLKPDSNPDCYDRPTAEDSRKSNVGFGMPRLLTISDFLQTREQALRICVTIL